MKTLFWDVFGKSSGVLLVLSGLGCISSLFGHLGGSRTYDGHWYTWPSIIVFLGTCFLRVLASRNSRRLVEKIENTEHLKFDQKLLLGQRDAEFMLFDQQARKIAICNAAKGEYKVKDYAFIRRWHYAHGHEESMQVGMNSHAELTHNVKREKANFVLMVEVTDPQRPVFHFDMKNEQMAIEWVARLGALLQ